MNDVIKTATIQVTVVGTKSGNMLLQFDIPEVPLTDMTPAGCQTLGYVSVLEAALARAK